MNRDEMAGSLGKLRQELQDGAKSISRMLIPAAERTIAECRYALLRLNAKLRDPANELTEVEDGAELQKALELARGYLTPEINALAKLRNTIREAFEEARVALLAADEELDSIGVCLQAGPVEQ
jgi:hypothetical protein